MKASLGPRNLLALLAGLLLALGVAPVAAQNLIKNGDFSRAGDPPNGWAKESEASKKGSVRVSGGVLELAPNARNTPSDKPLGLGQAIDATAMAGRVLLVSANWACARHGRGRRPDSFAPTAARSAWCT
jgi:hypothetical protein